MFRQRTWCFSKAFLPLLVVTIPYLADIRQPILIGNTPVPMLQPPQREKQLAWKQTVSVVDHSVLLLRQCPPSPARSHVAAKQRRQPAISAPGYSSYWHKQTGRSGPKKRGFGRVNPPPCYSPEKEARLMSRQLASSMASVSVGGWVTQER